MLGITLFFATDMHHLVIAALNDSYTLFEPGEVPATGDVAALITKTVSGAFRIGIQLSAPFLAFGLLFNLGLGVLSRLMPQMQVFFIALPLSIMIGFLFLMLVLGAMMGLFLDYTGGVLHAARAARLSAHRNARWPTNATKPNIQKTRRREAARGSHQARRRGQERGGQYLVHDRRRHADADGVRRRRWRRACRRRCAACSPIPIEIPIDGPALGRPRQEAGDACRSPRSAFRILLLMLAALPATPSSTASCSRSSRSCRSCRRFRRRRGCERLFSKQALANFAKGLAKLVLFGARDRGAAVAAAPADRRPGRRRSGR